MLIVPLISDPNILPERICAIVPAYNEAAVLLTSLSSLAQTVAPEHIYVVSDGSKDKTADIARQITNNVLALKKNRGKAGALAILIEKYQLTERYDYLMFYDADSRLLPGFAQAVAAQLALRPACIVGTVTSDRHGIVSAYRTYEYGLTHRLFKRAQNEMGTITVAPGCASLYRSDVVKQLEFSTRTITEDFDLTIQIYNKKLGRLVYVPEARVLTQDPGTIADYWKQVTRWYTGYWQNIFLHKLYVPKGRINFEIILQVTDGAAWVGSVILALTHPETFLHLIGMVYLIVCGLSLFILSLERAFWAMLYMPFFPIFQVINLTSYILSFFRALGKRKITWQKVDRYTLSTGLNPVIAEK